MKKEYLENEIKDYIEKEMAIGHFINESDNTDRIVDNFIDNMIEQNEELEDLRDYLLEKANDYLKENYERVGEVDKHGNYTGYFYDKEHFGQIEDLIEFEKKVGIVTERTEDFND